jgi:hypothetical protein
MWRKMKFWLGQSLGLRAGSADLLARAFTQRVR